MDGAKRRVKVLLDLRRYDDAEREIRAALAATPLDGELWCDLAVAADGRADWPAMLEAAERAVGVAPDLPAAHRLMAHALQRVGRRDDAVTAAETAVQLDPTSAVSLTVLADTLRGAGEPEAGVELTARALAHESSLTLAWEVRTLALLDLAKLASRAHQPDRAAACVSEAERSALHLLELDPTSAGAIRLLAAVRDAAGEVETTNDLLVQAAVTDPASPHTTESMRLDEARRLTEAGDHAGAAAVLEAAIDEQPNSAALRRALVFVLAELDRIDDAVSSALSAARLAPGHPRTLHVLCFALQRAGRYRDAFDTAMEVLLRYPDDVAIRIQAAHGAVLAMDASARVGRREDVLQWADRVLDLTSEAGTGELWWYRARAFMRLDRPVDALTAAGAALELGHDTEDLMALRARALRALDRPVEAYDLANGWRDRAPDSRLRLSNECLAAMQAAEAEPEGRRGRRARRDWLTRAEEAARRGWELFPDEASFAVNLGVVCSRTDRLHEAAHWYEVARSLGANSLVLQQNARALAVKRTTRGR